MRGREGRGEGGMKGWRGRGREGGREGEKSVPDLTISAKIHPMLQISTGVL